MLSAFHREKNSEIDKIIAIEEKNLSAKINTIKKSFEDRLDAEKKAIEEEYQLRIDNVESEKEPAIIIQQHRQKEVESLRGENFQKLNFRVGGDIQEIRLHYYVNPTLPNYFIFKTINTIDQARKNKVEGTGGLCSCNKPTHKRNIKQKITPIHCHCTIDYIKKLQNHYKEKGANKIISIQLQINSLNEEKKSNIEEIKKEKIKEIEAIEKKNQISDKAQEKIAKEIKILNQTKALSAILKEEKFEEQDISNIITIKIGPPPAYNPENKEGESEEENIQPGLPRSDFKKSKKLLNQILEQAHRVHYDKSCLRRSGTLKAFNIIKALACCINEIEDTVNPDDNIIYKKLKSACSPPDSEQKNDNERMTIHNALTETRRSVFFCCGLFPPKPPTKAEQAIQKTIMEIDNPIRHSYTNPFLEAIQSRHAFAFIPRHRR